MLGASDAPITTILILSAIFLALGGLFLLIGLPVGAVKKGNPEDDQENLSEDYNDGTSGLSGPVQRHYPTRGSDGIFYNS